jgi:hypothetical protein
VLFARGSFAALEGQRRNVNPTARTDLIRELEYLQQHGTSLSMLFVTARDTSCGLVAGIDDGIFTLDYVRADWLDFLGPMRFKSFCKSRGFPTERQRWGKERVVRSRITGNPVAATDIIDACFGAVFDISGPFGLLLNGYGWRPSNNSLEGDASKATRASG